MLEWEKKDGVVVKVHVVEGVNDKIYCKILLTPYARSLELGESSWLRETCMAERDHVPDTHALYLHLLKNHLENTFQILL